MMDKSLKKLSRLELLELMVKLSEENEALTVENAQMKAALSEQPRISRATKVGSIAELALQTNGFFEAAQRAADDYLREIKRMRDQLASRAAAAGPAQAGGGQGGESQALLQDAQAKARSIVRRAQAQAEATLADARAKAEATIADANRQSHTIISQANRQADAVISAARKDAARQQARTDSSQAPASNVASPARGRHARPAEGR